MRNKPKITCESNYHDIRIYINGILHILFPKGRIRLQSWYDGDKCRIYKIEIESDGMCDEYHYDEFETWKKILELLNQNIMRITGKYTKKRNHHISEMIEKQEYRDRIAELLARNKELEEENLRLKGEEFKKK